MDEKTWRAPKDVIEDPVFTSNLQKISPGRTGDIIEYEFMNIALKCGWEAFKNISQNGPIDCILINPISAKAYYVDCKSVKTHNEAISQLIALRQKRGMYNIYIGYIFNGKAAIQYGENLSDKIILDPIKEARRWGEHGPRIGLRLVRRTFANNGHEDISQRHVRCFLDQVTWLLHKRWHHRHDDCCKFDR